MPDTAGEIAERMNEVMFNASLLSELRAIEFVRRLLAEGRLDTTRYKSVLMHRIDGGAALSHFGAASKTRVDMGFLLQLFALGRDQGASNGCRRTARTWACARPCRLWTIHSFQACTSRCLCDLPLHRD